MKKYLYFMLLGLLVSGHSFAEENMLPPKVHGISMHLDLKYPNDFQHFDYVNPNAQKKGTLRLQAPNFDSLNPYLLKGTSIPWLIGKVYGTLMKRSKDEPFSLYGYLAETVQIPEDRSFIIFNLRSNAKFADGSPITADDVVFTFNTLKEKASPHIKMLYSKAKEIVKLGDLSVRLNLDMEKSDRETALLLCMMPVLSKKFFEKHPFEESGTVFPLASGPYQVKNFIPGKTLELERIKNYWGENIGSLKGQNNFDSLIFDCYRDEHIALEAFKGGGFDLIHETDVTRWEKDYNSPAVTSGKIKKVVMTHHRPMGMFGIALNMRRPPFDQEKVREAFITLMDQDWLIKNYYNSGYTPATSFFSNCDLEAKGVPQGREKEILDQYKEKLPAIVYEAPMTLHLSFRERLKKALDLLKEAGWEINGKDLVHKETKKPLHFELLIGLKPHEKIALAYADMLKKAGITMNIRYVDSTQYTKRKDDYDFDAVFHLWGQGMCPGKEQQFYWSSEAAGKPATRNYPGIKNPIVDELIEKVISQKKREEYVPYIKALDRVLWSGKYIVPLVYWNKDHFAYWDRFKYPKLDSEYESRLGYLTREDWAMEVWEAAS